MRGEENSLQILKLNEGINGEKISPNTNRYKITCIKCGIESNKRKSFKKLCDGFYCKKCESIKRKQKRDMILHTVAGVRRREDLEKEWAEKKKNQINLPKMKGAKRRGQNSISHVKGLYLTREEKQILFKKYIKKGYSSKRADGCIKEITVHLKCLVEKLKEQGKPEEEINRKFKEEFAKLISQ